MKQAHVHEVPYRNQRWIDAINVGSADILPFGVCEQVGTRVLPDGTEIQEVRQPRNITAERASLNGPQRMFSNSYGRVTNKGPAYARFRFVPPTHHSSNRPRTGEEYLIEQNNDRIFRPGNDPIGELARYTINKFVIIGNDTTKDDDHIVLVDWQQASWPIYSFKYNWSATLEENQQGQWYGVWWGRAGGGFVISTPFTHFLTGGGSGGNELNITFYGNYTVHWNMTATVFANNVPVQVEHNVGYECRLLANIGLGGSFVPISYAGGATKVLRDSGIFASTTDDSMYEAGIGVNVPPQGLKFQVQVRYKAAPNIPQPAEIGFVAFTGYVWFFLDQ